MKENIKIPAGTDSIDIETSVKINSGTIPPINKPPVVTLNVPAQIVLPEVLSLKSVATDPDGIIMTYLWSKVSGLAATLTTNNKSETTVTGLVPGAYVFSLKVTDDKGGETTAIANITVKEAIPVPTKGYFSFPLYPAAGGLSAGVGRVTGNNLTIKNYRFSNKGSANNGHNLWVSGTNITIENCFFDESTGLGIYVNGGSNVTIKNCLFADNNWGILAERCTGNIKILDNQFINMIWDKIVQGCCRGQLIFFNGCSGAGNEIIGNRAENFRGESYNEDLVNVFGSGGVSGSPLKIQKNIFRGGGPSMTSGGIIGGDVGGNDIDISDNKLVNPGWYGFQVVSGTNINFANNQAFSDAFPWSRIGFLVYRISGYPPCGNITVGTSNKSNFKKADGGNFDWETNGTCGPVTGPATGLTLAEMNIPDPLITFIDEDQVWQIRARKTKYDRLVANGLAHPGVDLSRPDANAGADQNITGTSTTLTSLSTAAKDSSLVGFKWVQVSGPNASVIASTGSSLTQVSGLIKGSYVFRLEVTQKNKTPNVTTQDADWVTINKN